MTTTLTAPYPILDPPDISQAVVLRALPALDLSDEQFYAFCQQNPDICIEQTAEGDWIIMPPTGFGTGSRNSDITRQLGNWARQDGTGVTADSSTVFVLPKGAKRSPDACWVLKSRAAPGADREIPASVPRLRRRVTVAVR